MSRFGRVVLSATALGVAATALGVAATALGVAATALGVAVVTFGGGVVPAEDAIAVSGFGGRTLAVGWTTCGSLAILTPLAGDGARGGVGAEVDVRADELDETGAPRAGVGWPRLPAGPFAIRVLLAGVAGLGEPPAGVEDDAGDTDAGCAGAVVTDGVAPVALPSCLPSTGTGEPVGGVAVGRDVARAAGSALAAAAGPGPYGGEAAGMGSGATPFGAGKAGAAAAVMPGNRGGAACR